MSNLTQMMFPRIAGRAQRRLPRVVYVLAAGTFLMGTTEFMIAGLLPDIADGLNVSEARAGLLITAFALGMIIGSPVMALATRRLPQRSVLTLALVIFAAGHVVAALSSSFTVLLVARVLTALATGAFWAVAAIVAGDAAGPGARSRAIGVVIGGLTLANVIGVPIGTWAGLLVRWRGPFWALAVLALTAAAVIGRLIPATERQDVTSMRTELAALRDRRLWLALGACALIMGGVLATYTYISPLLTEHAGIPAAGVPLVLIGFGLGALVGTTTGGRLGDRRPLATAVTAAAATAVILLALTTLSRAPAAAVVLVFLVALTSFAVNPILVDLSVRFAGPAATLGAALSTSAFNTGIAGGSWGAGLALDSSLGPTGPALVGTVITAMALVPLTILALGRATRTASSSLAPEPRAHRVGRSADAVAAR
jgi:predicted MFS family arabinose efflux permease